MEQLGEREPCRKLEPARANWEHEMVLEQAPAFAVHSRGLHVTFTLSKVTRQVNLLI